MSVEIDYSRCMGCGICVDICPEDVYEMGKEYPNPAREDECWYCGSCMMDCPADAINVVFPPHMRPFILKEALK